MGTDARPTGVGGRRRDTSGCAPSSSRTNRGIAKKTPATPLRSEQRWSDYAKSWRVPFALDSVVKPAFYSTDSTSDSSSVPSTPVRESGMARSKMSGVVLRSDWKELTDERVKVCECMMHSLESDQTSYVFKQVAGYLATKKLSFVLLVRDDECRPHSYMAVSAPPKRPYLIIYLFFIILHTLISKFNFSSFQSLKLNFSKFYS